MKKRILLLSFIAALTFQLNAQDTIRHLIFTVWNGAQMQQAFAQITNVGDSSIDLSNFTFENINSAAVATDVIDGIPVYNQNNRFSKRLSGRLEPGESYLLLNVWDALQPDGQTYQLPQMMPLTDLPVHCRDLTAVSDSVNPAMELWGKDSVDTYDFLLRNWSGLHASVLYYRLPNGDSVMIDQVNLNFDSKTMKLKNEPASVAGVDDATFNNLLVRKAVVTEGNMNWDLAASSTAEGSEWIVLPKWQTRDIYTVIKNFGDFSISLESNTVGINTNEQTLDVPWGIRKDSLIHEFTVGPGMAWHYTEDSIDFADSVHIISQDGDIFSVFACGNDLEQIDFTINVVDPADDMALVFPKRTLVYPSAEEAAAGMVPVWGGIPYYVTEDDPDIDTIGNVAFATRVDTLFKYIEWAPNASAEVIWVDGEERVDLKHGDILRVTAADGSTVKDYFIDVQDYMASTNAQLATITWPDKTEFMEGWAGDTIPLFDPGKKSYTITLPYGTTSIPALMAYPQNLRAQIKVQRAVSLKGSLQERTTFFNVTAEDDSTVNQYSVTFQVEVPDDLIQKYYAEPFVSEMTTNVSAWNSFLEIANPGNTTLDLSEYMFVSSRSSINPAEAIVNAIQANPTEANFQQRYLSYVPGFKYSDDTTQWILNPGKLYYDPEIQTIVEPGDVFVMATSNVGREQYISDEVRAKIDKWWNTGTATHVIPEEGVNVLFTPACLKRATEALFIFKITNDSIFNGTKEVGDPNDFELVDVVADPVMDQIWNIAGNDIRANTTSRITAKPYVYEGVTTIGEGLGTNAEDSDWTVEMYPADFESVFDMYNSIGSHNMDPVTAYMSTVSSLTYIVSDGFTGDLNIQGDLSGSTVNDFFGNISKADPGQTLTVINGTSGAGKNTDDPVADGDTLEVVSADGNNTTKYVLVNNPLDSDATLTAKDGSGYTIEIDGQAGTISGMDYGVTLEEVVENVIKPDLATMSIIDAAGALVPLQKLSYDTTYMKTVVGDSIFFEVVAQDGVSKITYRLNPTATSSDAYIISTLFEVDTLNHTVSLLPDGLSVESFMADIEPARGATVKIINKIGDEREQGIMYYDDKLVVTSEDQSRTVTYLLNFLMEPVNEAPTVEAYYEAENVVINQAVVLNAHVQDDGKPNPLAFTWEVIEGNASDVTIAEPNDTLTDVTFASVGMYKLVLTVTDGELITTDTLSFEVTFPINISENKAPGVSIYPNPVSTELTLEFRNLDKDTKTVRIINLVGSTVYTSEITSDRIALDVSKFEKGLYIISVQAGKYCTTKRISIVE